MSAQQASDMASIGRYEAVVQRRKDAKIAVGSLPLMIAVWLPVFWQRYWTDECFRAEVDLKVATECGAWRSRFN